MVATAVKKPIIWTDEEIEYLLKVILHHKAARSAAALYWETIRSKYDDSVPCCSACLHGSQTESFHRFCSEVKGAGIAVPARVNARPIRTSVGWNQSIFFRVNGA